MRAQVYIATGDWANAIRDLNEAVKERSNAATLKARAEAYYWHREYNKAIDDLSGILALAPDNVAILERRATIFRIMGKDADAIADYDLVIAAAPSYAALANRGIAHSNLGDGLKAIADLTAALNIAPSTERAWTYKYRAAAYLKAKNNQSAFDDYGAAIAVDTLDARPWFWRAQAYSQVNDFERAIADYDEAIKRPPGLIEAYLEAADLLVLRGEFGKAIERYYDRAAARYPKNADVFFRRARAYYGMHQFEKAIADYQIAQSLGLTLSWLSHMIGNAKLRRGEFKAAIESYLKVPASDDSYPYTAMAIYIARAKRGEASAELDLGAAASKMNAKEWPYPIVQLLLHKGDAESVLGAAGDDDERCEARFYIGEWYLLDSRREQAIASLRAAVAGCSKDFVEFADAEFELEQLKH
jgi:tetratricopeptide (TPR) repeat protein